MSARSARPRASVAAGHAATAGAAQQILLDGGSAADAAIAALWMACVCEPVLASPGGGGFATVMGRGRAEILDFFVDAPGRKQPEGSIEFSEVLADFGTTTQAFHVGAGASAVPGFVPGLFALHERYGRTPMRVLAEPAIIAAREGVKVSAFQAKLFAVVSPILTFTPQAAALFGADDGKTFAAGETMANPQLADTLDALSREGSRLATHGEIAALMAEQSEAFNGHLRRADLESFKPCWRAPVELRLGPLKVWTNPPPALGGALIAAMARVLSRESGGSFAMAVARAIDEVDRFWRQAPQDAGRLLGMASSRGHVTQRGTTHVSVADDRGEAVAVTVSNGEGNGRIVPGCGFMINNMLGEEDVNPRGFHAWEPGERLSSMMAPSVGTWRTGGTLAVGSGGSNRIRTAILQVLANIGLRELPLGDAVAAPRMHIERGFLDFEDILIEQLFEEEERDELVRAFEEHRAWAEPSLYFGGVHAAACLPSGQIDAAGDARREGAGLTVG
ncbi:gamma-glutamyltransferase [Tepidamorphus sp. 3E244]|uniref:gamma-glutamyltransferase n=1 Tax=Tepidamorphus sp. 3E244 TaxID=3385498 RepID=UPI0038FC0B6E